MTIMGKILAILNLLLSLAVGAFIIMTYVARTNWHAAYVNMENQVKVSKADALAFKTEMEHARGDKAQLEEQLAKQKAAADKEKQDLNAQIAGLSDKLKRASEEIGKHVASQNNAGDELQRRAKEVDYLKSLVALRDTDLAKQKKQNIDMQQSMVEATINANQERARNERLLQENERLAKDIRQMQQMASTTSLRSNASKKNPPPDDIEGKVKATDPSNGNVTVSVGSDNGLHRGNTLEVYRLQPEPTYLGTIQIVQVTPNEAVGRPLEPRGRNVIHVGDQVSSNIIRK
ncbi:MAG TPA: hypothetical protein VKU02_13605 [Gemmataceae bacterium]|nr:hypothetical protein [Gemmataceae bacterium]